MEFFIFHEDICQKPPKVENANETLNIDPDIARRYPVSTVLTMTCGDTYYQSGPINITCLTNGNWSDDTPVCEGNSTAEYSKL